MSISTFNLSHYHLSAIPLAGQLGSNQGGFDCMTGESQVTQVITQWRLNVSATITYMEYSLLKQNS